MKFKNQFNNTKERKKSNNTQKNESNWEKNTFNVKATRTKINVKAIYHGLFLYF